MSKLVLIDVENTIVKDPKKNPKYLQEAILNVYGLIADDLNLDDYEGLTTQETVIKILTENGFEKKVIDAKISQFIVELEYSYYNVIGLDKLFQTDKIIIGGSRDFVNAMSKNGVTLGVASGQLEKIINMKLERTQTQQFFSIGTYGNEAEKISEIITLSIDKAKNQGTDPEKSEIFVIGSYPKIISAAKALGLRALGVTSGKYSSQELSEAGAEVIAKGLNDRNLKNAIER